MERGHERITCWSCRSIYWLPPELYRAAKASPAISFFCPYGHSAHFPTGPSEEDKLRQERDRLKQAVAYEQDRVRAEQAWREAAQRQASAMKGVATKLKKRAAAGICPCCNRSFENLRRHMTSKHKGFVAEEVTPDGAVIQ